MNVMSLSVLSLNKVYQPIGLISVKEAIESIFTERAEIVDVEENGDFLGYDVNSWLELSLLKNMMIEEGENIEEIWINSKDPFFIAPKVIRYLHYDKFHQKKIKFSRKNIIIRDNYRCIYCNKKFPIENLQLEHLIPRSRGGKTTWENTATACYKCNSKKSNRTPEESGMKLHWKPFKPKFLFKKNKLVFKDNRYKLWEHFISDAYWSTELEE